MTSATGAARRSTDAEIDALDKLCDRLSGFDPAHTLWSVDGWLAVLACGPVRLPPERWLPLAFDDTFDRAFADPVDRVQALAVLQARLDVLHDELDAQALLAEPDRLRLDPIFDDWSDEDRARMAAEEGTPPEVAATLQPGALWADGVITAFQALAGPAWQLPDDEDLMAEVDDLLLAVAALARDPNSEAQREYVAQRYPQQAPSRDELLADACFALQDLRVLLLDHGPVPETRRVAAQPGRNDPCPCGSGKKYKKCHGVLT